MMVLQMPLVTVMVMIRMAVTRMSLRQGVGRNLERVGHARRESFVFSLLFFGRTRKYDAKV